MERFFRWFNLCGVMVLLGVCVWQWQVNRRSELARQGLESTVAQLGGKLAELTKTLVGAQADMEEFRQRLVAQEQDNRAAKTVGQKQTVEISRLTAERDQLKTALAKWSVAVDEREAAIKQLTKEIATLTEARNTGIERANAITLKYNAAVEQINVAGKKLQELLAQRNDAVAKFNELAEKYNALVKSSDSSPK